MKKSITVLLLVFIFASASVVSAAPPLPQTLPLPQAQTTPSPTDDQTLPLPPNFAPSPNPPASEAPASQEETVPAQPFDRFPNPASCPQFQNDLQLLKNYYDQGVAQARAWQTVANKHSNIGNRWDSLAGKYISYPAVQIAGVGGAAVAVVAGAGAVVSTPVLIIGLIVAGGAAYFFWHRGVAYHNELEHDRKVEIQRIDYLGLVKASQDYDRDFIWPEQVARFKRLVQLNSKEMGLPTYKGGYQAFPIQDLAQVLNLQFSYFSVRLPLLLKGYQQLKDLPQDTNWYVHLTTQRHANLVKAKLARELFSVYAYQARLAFGTALALDQSCPNVSAAPLVSQP